MKYTTMCFALLLIGLSANASAQVTANATIGVTIVTPIGITKSVDMDFGNIAVGVATAGTTILSTDGSRSATGGVTLPATNGSPKPAAFIITGADKYTYSISLPSSPIALTGTTSGVTVGSFKSNPNTIGALTSGTQTVTIGATLMIPASTAADTYKNSAGLSVTVNYN